MDALKKLTSNKKADKDMDPKYKAAKMGVLNHISNMAGDAMGKGLDQLKTVMVGSNDRSGLEAGLDKAKQIVSKGNRPLNSDDFEPRTGENEHNSSDEHQKGYASGGMAGGGNMSQGSGMSDQAVDDDDEQSEATEQSQRFADGGMARGSGKSDQAVSDDDEQSESDGQGVSKYADGGMSLGNQDNDAMPDDMDDTGMGGLSTEDIDELIAELQRHKARKQ